MSGRVSTVLVSLRERHRWVGIVVLTLIIGAPALVAVLSNVAGHWYPTGDVSHTELMLRSIPRHPPLVGVAARVGSIFDQGSTPGPSMAYLLFPVYFVLGRTSEAVLVSTLVVHLSAIFATLWLVRRWSSERTMLVFGVVFAVMVRALAPRFFLEPWNVWIPFFAYALFLVLAWGVFMGHRRAIPIVFAVGYHLVQTHISYVPMVAATLVAVSIRSIVIWRRESGFGRLVGWVSGITVLMWAPPVIEQFQDGTGNLRRLLEHFTSPESATVGVWAAVKAMAGEFNLWGPFVTGPGKAPYDTPNPFGLVLFVMVVGVGALVVRRDRALRTLYAVVAGNVAVGLLATSRIFGEFYDYVIRWMWIQAAVLVAVSVAAIVARVSADRVAVGAIVCVLGLSVAGSVSSVGADPPYRADSRVVGGLAATLSEVLDDDANLLLRWHDPASLGGTSFGLVLELEKRGVDVHVEPWAGAAARRHRTMVESDADVVLWLVTGQENIERFATRADATLLAETDPRLGDEIDESNRLRADIERMMNDVDHADWIDRLDSQYGHMQVLLFTPVSDELFTAVARYSELRVPVAVFAVPPGAPYFP